MDRPRGEEVRAEWRRALEAALRGPAMARSERGRRLLAYLVEETLAGRRERITGTTIAQDVLGRDASFEGRHDAIVRVQMRRLRLLLARDQAAGMPGDAPWIVVPKGGYRPELRLARSAPGLPAPAQAFAERPAPPPRPPPDLRAAPAPPENPRPREDGERERD